MSRMVTFTHLVTPCSGRRHPKTGAGVSSGRILVILRDNQGAQTRLLRGILHKFCQRSHNISCTPLNDTLLNDLAVVDSTPNSTYALQRASATASAMPRKKQHPGRSNTAEEATPRKTDDPISASEFSPEEFSQSRRREENSARAQARRAQMRRLPRCTI
jgi:hypothetical protein